MKNPMKCLSLFVLAVALSTLTVTAKPTPLVSARLRGTTSSLSASDSERGRSLVSAGSGSPPFYYTVVVDLQGMSPSGFSCSLQGYSLAPDTSWDGIYCTPGCGGPCGLITFPGFQPGTTDVDPVQYFLDGLSSRNYFPYAPKTDDATYPNLMCFSAIMDLTIPLTNGTALQLEGLRLGYDGTGEWWVGSASCASQGGSRGALDCPDENLVLFSTCDDHYYTDDSLTSGYDGCVQLSAP